MNFNVDGFDWDAGNEAKCAKHGLTRSQLEEFFAGEVHIIADVKHSAKEKRFLALGRSSAKRGMLVGFTLRRREGKLLIRPITARYMHAKEVRRYEEEIAKIQKR